MYIYIYIYVCVDINIYIYIYIMFVKSFYNLLMLQPNLPTFHFSLVL